MLSVNVLFPVVWSKVLERGDWVVGLAVLVLVVGAKGVGFRGEQPSERTKETNHPLLKT